MSIVSAEDLMNEANLGRQTDPAILAPHIDSASVELKRILGEEKFLQIESYQSSSIETEQKILSEVRKGAVYLAMSYAVHSINIETQGSGIVNVKGWNKSSSELLSRDEINDLSRYFRETAMLFLQPYIPGHPDGEDQTGDLNLGGFYLGAL